MSATECLHASCVAVGGQAVLILGPSGSGKSALALDLMALGAGLVADDRTNLTPGPDGPVASCPPTIAGRIEARFVGILNAAPHAPAPVKLVVDLGQVETDRLPPPRHLALLGFQVPLLHNCASGHFPAAILQYLKASQSPAETGSALQEASNAG